MPTNLESLVQIVHNRHQTSSHPIGTLPRPPSALSEEDLASRLFSAEFEQPERKQYLFISIDFHSITLSTVRLRHNVDSQRVNIR